MKKLALSLLVGGSVLALSACGQPVEKTAWETPCSLDRMGCGKEAPVASVETVVVYEKETTSAPASTFSDAQRK